jgi:16S rRNA (cytosine967-C5)-methyltransferase
VSGENPRQIALQILSRRSGPDFVEDLLDSALQKAQLQPVDRGLCQELVYGVVRWQSTLDWLIARKSRNPPGKPALQNLLRLGLYQIFWLARIPNHAAVNESVELAKRNGFAPQAGFVNALLRGYLRDFESTRHALEELKIAQPHLGFSHPEWLVKRWQARWGAEAAAKLMAWNNTPPKTFARVNTLKTTAEKLLPQWREENVEYDFVRHDWLEENLVFELKSHPPLAQLPSFKQGLFYAQDPSTLLAVRELAPVPGETVLDLCAAPGGKLTYAAQLMRNEALLIAHDIAPERLKLIEENCTRLGVTCTQVVSSLQAAASWANPAKALPTFYDKVLVDAPCSNTGVMRRRVELRWRIKPEEIERLSRMQLELLEQASRLVRPGGVLVYSTCSLEAEENEQVIQQFLDEHAGFAHERSTELKPWAEQTDGGFVATFKRTG